MQNNNTGHNGAKRRKTRKAAVSRQSAPVTVTVHDPRALKVAQSIVAGYYNRGFGTHIIGNEDGTVSVVNGM